MFSSQGITLVSGTTRTGLYAADGSINAVASTTSTLKGLYHPCGAYNITFSTSPDVYFTDGSLVARLETNPVTINNTNIATNGDFTVSTGWTAQSGWTISGGVATRVPDAASTSVLRSATLTEGNSYLFIFEIKARTGGTFTPLFAGGTTVTGTARSTVGVFSQIMVAVAGNNDIRVRGNPGANGTIDNIRIYDLGVI